MVHLYDTILFRHFKRYKVYLLTLKDSREKISPKLVNMKISGFLKDVLRRKAGKVDRYLKCNKCSIPGYRIMDEFYFFFVLPIFSKLFTMKLYHLFNNLKFVSEGIKQKHIPVTPLARISKTGPRGPPQ